MSYVGKLQEEVTLVRGESPHDFMLRYMKLAPIAPGMTVQDWVDRVTQAYMHIGHPDTPLAVENEKAFRYLTGSAATNIINQHRAPSRSNLAAVSDSHIYLAVCMSTMQRTLDQLRRHAPEWTEGLPDIEPERTATLISGDLKKGLSRYDELHAQGQQPRR